jgi:hypothetical protein
VDVTNIQTYVHPLHIKLIIHQFSTKQYCPFINQVYRFCRRKLAHFVYFKATKSVRYTGEYQNTTGFIWWSSIVTNWVQTKGQTEPFNRKSGKKIQEKDTPIIVLTTFEICLQVSNVSFTKDLWLGMDLWNVNKLHYITLHWVSSENYGHFTGCNIKVKKIMLTYTNEEIPEKELEPQSVTAMLPIKHRTLPRLNSWTMGNGLLPTGIYQIK